MFKNKMQKPVRPAQTGHDVFIQRAEEIALGWYNLGISEESEELIRLVAKRSVFELKTLPDKKRVVVRDGLFDSPQY